MFDQSDAVKCRFGSHPVTIIEHHEVQMSDGVMIACKIWFPASVQQTKKHFPEVDERKISTLYTGVNDVDIEKVPVPAIMEYVPYRKNDDVCKGDHTRHSWFCSHGYVSIRPDIRGSGDSGGFYYDEYTKQELSDGCELIGWLCSQPWCNGAVGMYGKSWAGFNGLQIGFLQPPGLKAVISVYSTDNRYTDDIHYMGGCMMGTQFGNFTWANFMFMYNARPPYPHNVPNWKEVWIERLKKYKNWGSTWLQHQRYDEYWKHGSICEDYSRVKVPVLAIGGWADLYTNCVWRMVENLPNCRGIIGPWSHDWPDCADPGPNVDFLQECLSWWDCHLKGKQQNGVEELPAKLRLFMQESTLNTKVRDGKWMVYDSHKIKTLKFVLNNNKQALQKPGDDSAPCLTGLDLTDSPIAGFWAGEGTAFGNPSTYPTDQTEADKLWTCWDSEPLLEDVSVVGFPKLVCTVSIENGTSGMLAVRLCDVFPDGQSAFITHRVLNMNYQANRTQSKVENVDTEYSDINPGEKFQVALEMNSAAYCVLKGHRLRLAMSSSYFPFICPFKAKSTVRVYSCADPGEVSAVLIPVQQPDACSDLREDKTAHDSSLVNLLSPSQVQHCPKVPIKILRPNFYSKELQYNKSTKEYTMTITNDEGATFYEHNETLLAQKYTDVFSITEEEPLSAKSVSTRESVLEWPQLGIKTRVETVSEMWGDEEELHVTDHIQAQLNGESVYQNKSESHIKRDII